MKLLKLLIISSITFYLMTSCNNKNQYTVSCFLQESKTDGEFSKLLVGYALDANGIKIEPEVILKIYDNFQKEIFGGVAIGGTLTIDNSSVKFEAEDSSFLIVV